LNSFLSNFAPLEEKLSELFGGETGNGTENTPDVFRHDNCEKFFEQLSRYLSSTFSFSHKKEKGSETHLC
jgi:hypothetical protein